MKLVSLFKNTSGSMLKYMAVFWLAIFVSASFANNASARYVYNVEKENKRNEKQKPKKNDFDKSCSREKHKTKFCPQSSPFIEKYLKDYSNVKGRSEFTDRYLQDYSDVKNSSEFTDRYLQDYSNVKNSSEFTDRYLQDYSGYDYYNYYYY